MGLLDDLTRRECLGWFGGIALLSHPEIAGALHAQHEKQAASSRFAWFDANTAAEVEALVAQIIPSDETPGAREAGVIHFIERALATFDQEKQSAYKAGLEEAHDQRQKMFPQSKSISALTIAQQIELLEAIEKSSFFELLRFHTLVGTFALPSWGGNRNEAGWKLIGFEDAHVFRPPFGYYDDPKHATEDQ
jgi:hypothetical protein